MPSMISDLIDASMDDTGEIKDEEFIAGMAGNVYIGGFWNGKSITGINPTPRDMSDFYSHRPLPQGLLICVFAMLMNPDAQSCAQTEIYSLTSMIERSSLLSRHWKNTFGIVSQSYRDNYKFD